MQGCSATAGQLTFLGYTICLLVSGFPVLILCEQVDLEPCKIARGFGEHLLCIYTEVVCLRRRVLPSLKVPFEFLTFSFSAGSPLSHIPTWRVFFYFITNSKSLNSFLKPHLL